MVVEGGPDKGKSCSAAYSAVERVPQGVIESAPEVPYLLSLRIFCGCLYVIHSQATVGGAQSSGVAERAQGGALAAEGNAGLSGILRRGWYSSQDTEQFACEGHLSTRALLWQREKVW